MKKTVALAILGLGVVGINSAVAQGHVSIWNYGVAPYNQIVWDASTPGVGGQAVNDTAVNISVWIAPGVGADPATLVPSEGPSFTVNPGITYDPGAGAGGGGYYDGYVILTPGEGDYTAQLRFSGTSALGDVFGASQPFEVTAGSRSLPVVDSGLSIGGVVVVPEPTTFALAGLGAAALLIFRRRD